MAERSKEAIRNDDSIASALEDEDIVGEAERQEEFCN